MLASHLSPWPHPARAWLATDTETERLNLGIIKQLYILTLPSPGMCADVQINRVHTCAVHAGVFFVYLQVCARVYIQKLYTHSV